jgi:hypothetical protein
MQDTTALERELERFQKNYSLIDQENDLLKAVNEAAENLVDYSRKNPVLEPELFFALVARLSGAVQRSREARKQRRKRKG